MHLGKAEGFCETLEKSLDASNLGPVEGLKPEDKFLKVVIYNKNMGFGDIFSLHKNPFEGLINL